MSVLLARFIRINRLTSGRQLFALRKTLKQALDPGDMVEIQRLLTEAIASTERWRQIEAGWALQSAPRRQGAEGGVSKTIDVLIDGCLGGFDDTFTGTARSLGADHPKAKAALRLQRAMFPLGLAAVVQLPFVEEVETITEILKALEQEAPKADVILLHMEDNVERLRALNAQYRAALEAEAPREILFKEVTQAAGDSHAQMLAVVVGVLSRFDQDHDPAHLAARQDLLGEILKQHRAISDARRTRRAPKDIDPDTGVEVDAPAPLEA